MLEELEYPEHDDQGEAKPIEVISWVSAQEEKERYYIWKQGQVLLVIDCSYQEITSWCQ